MKTIGIMQPYFLPYIGYFQLFNAVDEFVIYDNIEFTKKGWFNRNRMLQNGKDVYFTLPLKKDSDFLDVNQRYLSDTFETERVKLLNKIENNYRKAPFFNEFFPKVESIFNCKEENLFNYIYNSLLVMKDYLGIETKIILSSSLGPEIKELRFKNKVFAICKKREADRNINAIGGMELYKKEEFAEEGIQLNFIKSEEIEYQQIKNDFVPSLSILDVLMFNKVETVKGFLNRYELI